MDEQETTLRTVALTKRFGDVLANDDISLEVRKGEIHCLLGENGAGKTTLAECLYGFYQPDSGLIYFQEEKVDIRSPSKAIKLGIGMVHQHYVLVRRLSVLENIVVGTDAARPILNMNPARERLRRLCADYRISLDLDAGIWQLSIGEQQWVEILKSVFGGVKLLILDEPTAVLTPQEADSLFNILNQMRSKGISVIFITHKLHEVMDIADRVTVLRKGKKEATVRRAEVTERELAKMMVGREVLFRVTKKEPVVSEPVLEVRNLHVLGGRGREVVKGLSMQVGRGEIVGVAGVSGNGQRELFEAIVGVRKIEEGRILLDGSEITNEKPQSISSKGLAHVPEDRLMEGLVAEFSVAENLMLGLHRDRFFWRGIYLNSRELSEFATECIRRFSILTPSIGQRTRSLSGGNLQRLVLARELSTKPKCLVASQPTRGLDVGAIEYIHKQIIEQRDAGVGVLLFSEDLDEILNLSDRIVVFFKGEIMGSMKAKDATREAVGLLMAGIRQSEQ